MNKIDIIIDRFDPEAAQKGYTQEYTVFMDEDQVYSVMNLLEHIYQNIDPTLAFFRHAACKQAACGKCLVKVNGKTVLSCKEVVSGEKIHLQAYKESIVKDLVCD